MKQGKVGKNIECSICRQSGEDEVECEEEGERMVQDSDLLRLLQIKVLKLRLAEMYIWDDPKEKAYFLKTSDKDIHDWGADIAGRVLTKRGQTLFRRDDIQSILKTELANEVYGGKYATESQILPADISWNANQRTEGFLDSRFPALEGINLGERTHEYRFLGFGTTLTKKLGRFKRDSLRQVLQEYQQDC